MDNYLNVVKGWYQSGQEYISSYSDSGQKKAAFVKIDKSSTMYDARCFHNTQLDTKKCIRTLTNLIYLFNQGQHFTQDQGTQLFFAITKLLQSEDVALRRIVYVSVKQMKKHPSIYVVTSSLLKDIHHKNSHFRRNSLRTIPLIADSSNLSQIERYIKALIVDPDAGVSSAALLSGLQMFRTNEELVKKWGTQITEKLNSKDPYVQCHALMLLGDTKRKDFNSYKKILFSLMNQNMTGLAAVQYLRMLRDISRNLDHDSPETADFIKHVCKEARSKDDMVQIEACKLACESSLMSNKELLQIIKILQVFLISESTVKKYSVLKIFNSLLKNQFRKSLIINVKQIQKVLNGKNLSLSSIAASILLRICSQNYLETLFTRIEKTMSQMSTEYKRDVVKSLSNVLKAYPKKYELINKFLINIMKKQDSYAIKSDIIQVLNFQIREIGGQAKTQCIKQLSKLLSATNYNRIHFQILGVISRETSKEDVNSQIFKNIISEIYLQEGAVRACGLSTLIKLSEHEVKQKDALNKTIEQFKNDSSLEVRERLLFKQKEKPLSSYELDILENYLQINQDQIKESKDKKMLNFDHIKKWGAEVGSNIIKEKKVSPKEKEIEKAETDQYQTYKQIFENHPTFKAYGTLRKINKPLTLSDSDSDLFVTMRLFLFDEAFIAEFKVNNNLENTVIQNVKVELKHSGQVFEVVHLIPAKVIKYKSSSESFVGLKKSQQCEDLFAEQKFTAITKFTVKQMSGNQIKASYQEQFSLENFQIKLSSYIAPWLFDPSQFTSLWEKMKGAEEKRTYQLKYSSTQAAEHELLKHFGLKKIQNPESSQANMVTVNLAGKFLGSQEILMILILAFDTKMGCLLKIRVKTEDEDLTNELIESIE